VMMIVVWIRCDVIGCVDCAGLNVIAIVIWIKM
jgi:hypothetical protein